MEGVIGVYIPISVWNDQFKGVSFPDGAVVHQLSRSKNTPIGKRTIAAPSPFEARFQEIWAKYPRRIGTKQAHKAFLNSVKTEQDWSDINAALDNYKKNMPDDINYVKHGATWFNNWKDYVVIATGVTKQSFVKSL